MRAKFGLDIGWGMCDGAVDAAKVLHEALVVASLYI
eukprot:CAMPEP_0201181598 /NCGR_PEP_ID=MMETSP0851-20130426/119189_1 /ASSEMBLY_ACC=CAM_ASM_000631 /TAXON_ID=183588 /ORGANISM="Pseudo-nitzschia fraudulenta, Strain WWA7" /LENGTH=35 /DNA_ID= /DNA_START= /DNA_END= /DNA_ORIENTATION=